MNIPTTPIKFPPYEAFYIESMKFNSESILATVEQLNGIIEHVARGEVSIEDIDHTAILDLVQNIVVHAAMLSQYFFPQNRNNQIFVERAKHLREKFQVDEDNPLLTNRDLRHYLQHFDERLDMYLKKEVFGNFLPSFVSLTEPKNDGVPRHIFKAFYIKSAVFQTLTERYAINPIIAEVARLHDLFLDKN